MSTECIHKLVNEMIRWIEHCKGYRVNNNMNLMLLKVGVSKNAHELCFIFKLVSKVRVKVVIKSKWEQILINTELTTMYIQVSE